MFRGKIFSVGKCFLTRLASAWKQRNGFLRTLRNLKWTWHQVFHYRVINLWLFCTRFSLMQVQWWSQQSTNLLIVHVWFRRASQCFQQNRKSKKNSVCGRTTAWQMNRRFLQDLWAVVDGRSSKKPILTCCASWWTIEELEVGRGDGKEGVRVPGANVLVNSGVVYDMLREVWTVLENAHCFILSHASAWNVSDGWLGNNTAWQTARMRKKRATKCSVYKNYS